MPCLVPVKITVIHISSPHRDAALTVAEQAVEQRIALKAEVGDTSSPWVVEEDAHTLVSGLCVGILPTE